MAEGNRYFEIADKAGGKVLAITFDGGEGHVQRAEVKDISDFAADAGPNQDRRAFLIPGARVFVHLGADGKSIHWRQVKLSDELAKSPQDYLVVAGSAPATAVRGRRWNYEPKVLTNTGNHRLQLETGPPGMELAGMGLAWEVPADFAPAAVAVELAIESKAKPSVGAKHRFTVSLLAKASDGVKWFAPELKHPAPSRRVPAGNSGDPLAFLGEPGKFAKRFATYRTPVKLSTPEAATLTLLTAPSGARWEGDDLVWKVPPEHGGIPEPVFISAKTATGKEICLGYLLDIQE